MGIIKQGILGGFSGKVANIVGSSWKGIAIIKSLPLSVANPQTAGQVAQRTKLSNTVAFAKQILSSVIKPLRDRFAVQESGYNTFVSDNIALFADAMPNPAEDLIVASGKMASTEIKNLTTTAGSPDITVDWLDDSGSGFKLSTDDAYIVAVNETQENIAVSSASAVRSDGTVVLSFDADSVAGDTMNIYLVFMRADGTIVSETSFLSDTV